MALAYIIIALTIIGLNISQLPDILILIVSDAFTPMAGAGAAIGWGVRRGIYSNEAVKVQVFMQLQQQKLIIQHNKAWFKLSLFILIHYLFARLLLS